MLGLEYKHLPKLNQMRHAAESASFLSGLMDFLKQKTNELFHTGKWVSGPLVSHLTHREPQRVMAFYCTVTGLCIASLNSIWSEPRLNVLKPKPQGKSLRFAFVDAESCKRCINSQLEHCGFQSAMDCSGSCHENI